MTQIDELVKRLRADTDPGGCDLHNAADIIEDQSAELTRLRERNAELENTLKLHAGDCMSLSNEIDQMRRNAEDDAQALTNAADRIATLEAQLKSFREALDNATSRARMNDSDGAQVSVDNYHLKNGRRILMSALRNAEGEKNGEPSGD